MRKGILAYMRKKERKKGKGKNENSTFSSVCCLAFWVIGRRVLGIGAALIFLKFACRLLFVVPLAVYIE